jgi:hypothetical protein
MDQHWFAAAGTQRWIALVGFLQLLNHWLYSFFSTMSLRIL